MRTTVLLMLVLAGAAHAQVQFQAKTPTTACPANWTAVDHTGSPTYSIRVDEAAVDAASRRSGVRPRAPEATVRAAVAGTLTNPTDANIDAAIAALIADGVLTLNAGRVRRFCTWAPAP